MIRGSNTVLSLFVLALFFRGVGAEEIANAPKEQKITTAAGKVGDLLRQWWREGTAAGNEGDFYDNRDGGHSDLDMSPYPQLQRIVYSSEDIKSRRHWAAQLVIRPGVVFGNSSTSAPPLAGGSNPRMVYVHSNGIAFLYKEYRANNLYIYPEHRDHDPGHNGPGEGFGDLYPTNTPYLIISQGSSGSDQPFMRAVPYTLAAFRPEVKKKLTASGLLMPTLQMLLRSTYRPAQKPGAYLTARAHPSVFEGSGVDDLAMVNAAHAITLEDIPPLARLKVEEETEPILGRDFFEPRGSERLADTPCVIARIFRGRDFTRRMVISAAQSFDVNNKPLSFHWVVLRGDKDKIKITPRRQDQALVEIVVPYHDRRPITPGSALESNRVDIGVFANNGKYNSAPAFITFFSLDTEARSYDAKGRVLAIGYGMGQVKATVVNWPAFLETCLADAPGTEFLNLPRETREHFSAALPKVKDLLAARRLAQEAVKLVQSAKEKKADQLAKAQQELAGADKAFQSYLDNNGPSRSLRAAADALLASAVGDLSLLPRFFKDPTREEALAGAIQKDLTRLGVLPIEAQGRNAFELLPRSPSPYEIMLIERANATLLAKAVLPGVLSLQFTPNFVDQRLTTRKTWRDVYHYDDKGRLVGWTRYDLDKQWEFNADGHWIVATDQQGRCLKARPVRYVQEPIKSAGLNANPLRFVVTDELVTYAYQDRDDHTGKIVSREMEPQKK